MVNLSSFFDDFAKNHDIIIGACDAAPLDRARLASSDSFVPFVSGDIEKRTDPKRTLRGAESVIVIGVGEQKSEVRGQRSEEERGARLSSLGVNCDYHVYVRELLQKLVDGLKRYMKVDFAYKILVDGGGLDERQLACRAGLGFIGRNGMVISQKFGSRFNIGGVVSDIPLDAEYPQRLEVRGWKLEKTGGGEKAEIVTECPPGCDLCMKACPTGALGGSRLDAERCISYLTQKDNLTIEEEAMLHGQLYGCDICRDACPFNEPQQAVFIDPQNWLDMGDEDFVREYSHTAMLWRGMEILRRNARIALGRL